MKALSLTQPWGWLVIHGGKDVENRRWNTRLRGRFLVHAAKGMTEDQYEDAVLFALQAGGQELACRIPSPRELERGGIVGVAELFEVLPPAHEFPPSFRANHAWHMPEQFGFRLRNVEPLPFLPCKGALGFWGSFDVVDGKAVQL